MITQINLFNMCECIKPLKEARKNNIKLNIF